MKRARDSGDTVADVLDMETAEVNIDLPWRR